MKYALASIFIAAASIGHCIAQNYTSYLTGSSADVSPSVDYGVCLMGGATEDDNAMIWLLQKATGGDVVVIRTSGSDGYNNYLYSQLGVAVNSVETIVFNHASASSDGYVLQQLQNAEMIWIAGGDQGVYEAYWKDTQVETILNNHINVKQAPIGGTSAGMAILGGDYFNATNGTITSSQALANPFHPNLTIATDFLSVPLLQDVTTDTHFDNPDRKGRLTTFLARQVTDHGHRAFAIACDEYTAVCIDQNGIAKVYGDYPNYDDNAYFLQANCVEPFAPETCNPSTPLTWNRNGAAIKVYAVKGTSSGSSHFDLNDWETGNGGEWVHWYVTNGALNETPGSAPNCSQTVSVESAQELTNYYRVGNELLFGEVINEIRVLDSRGRMVKNGLNSNKTSLEGLSQGLYIIQLDYSGQRMTFRTVVQ